MLMYWLFSAFLLLLFGPCSLVGCNLALFFNFLSSLILCSILSSSLFSSSSSFVYLLYSCSPICAHSLGNEHLLHSVFEFRMLCLVLSSLIKYCLHDLPFKTALVVLHDSHSKLYLDHVLLRMYSCNMLEHVA